MLIKILIILLIIFILLSIIAFIKKGDSIYDNEPEQKNLYEGKKIIFIENEDEEESVDGLKGHIEIVGTNLHESSFYDKYTKRFFDIVLSFFGLVILSPVFLVISIAIYFDDPGSVFFVQKRIGKNKQFFKLHKFRSMKISAPHEMPTRKLKNSDNYITRVGRFIRKQSLDELPQLWDIFVGNMSIVGPRPVLWNEYHLIIERDKYCVYDIKPGLTGWAQINGRDLLSVEDKVYYDNQYIEKESMLFDIICIYKTIQMIINK